MARPSLYSRLRRFSWRLLLLSGLAVALFQYLTWPDVSVLVTAPPTTTAFMEHYRGGEHSKPDARKLHWQWVSYSAISPNLKKAILVSEDINFFDHQGFAEDEILAALKIAVEKRQAPRGASTLSQQLVKNLWLSPSRNPWRKVKEAFLTRRLEETLEKRRIFEIYLNVVEFGPGIYGAEAASRNYFSKGSSSLGVHEAALLAASLPRPKTWNPRSSSKAYARKVETIKRRMAKAAWLEKVI